MNRTKTPRIPWKSTEILEQVVEPEERLDQHERQAWLASQAVVAHVRVEHGFQ